MNTRLPKFAQRNQGIEGDRIVIIAILAGMLLPALEQARAKGRAISCVNNMKQLGSVAGMYKNDYRFAIPGKSMKALTLPDGMDSDDYSYNGVGSSNSLDLFELYVPTKGTYVTSVKLSNYMGRGQWACPEKPNLPNVAVTNNANRATTVTGNIYLDKNFLKSEKCKYPSRLAYYGEVTSDWGGAKDYWGQFCPIAVDFPHSSKTVCNVLYWDLHVNGRKLGSFSYTLTGNTNKYKYTPFWLPNDTYSKRIDNSPYANNEYIQAAEKK